MRRSVVSRDHQKVIFVGGLHKSGTTLFHDILANSTQVSSLCDRGLPCGEGQYIQSQLLPDIYYGEILFGLSTEAYLTETSFSNPDIIGEKMFCEWKRYWQIKSEYLLEKSPINVVRTRFLQRVFPKSIYIVLIRDPRTAYIAAKKNMRRITMETYFRNWVAIYNTFLEDQHYLTNSMLVQYENLLSYPTDIIDECKATLCIDLPDCGAVINCDTDEKYRTQWNVLYSEHAQLLDKVVMPKWSEKLGYTTGKF